MAEQAQGMPWWQDLARMMRKHRRRPDWWLQVPPAPPLLTGKAVQAVLRDVGLLLDYLNRLPETRLDRYFRARTPQEPLSDTQPTPPCASQAYFLDRIAAIAAKGDSAAPDGKTEPCGFAAADLAEKDGPPGCGEGSRLADLAFLIWSRDFLAAIARPATLDTIRVTRAYRAGRMIEGVKVQGTEATTEQRDTEDERDIFMSRYGVRIARRVRRFQKWAVVLLWLSLYLSFMVYSGQVLMHENSVLQKDQAAHETRLKEAAIQEEALVQTALRADPSPSMSLHARGYCEVRSALPPDSGLEVVRIATSGKATQTAALGGTTEIPTPKLRLYVSDRQRALCEDREKLVRREADLKGIHGAWSKAALPVMFITAPWMPLIGWLEGAPRPKAEDLDLETHRYGMQQMINGLLAGIMPAMYAALGALASLFRRLSQKADDERLGPADYGGMMSSVVLGGLTGAVIGLFANVAPQGTEGAGLPLSTTALALLAGYAADRVFAMFDSLAERVFVVPDASGRKAADRSVGTPR